MPWGSYDLKTDAQSENTPNKPVANGHVNSSGHNHMNGGGSVCNGVSTLHSPGIHGYDSNHTDGSHGNSEAEKMTSVALVMEEKTKIPASGQLSESSSDSSLQNDSSKVTLFVKKFRKGHMSEKLIHMVSLITMVVLAMSIVEFQWFIPYYYTISTPLLIAYRLVMYIKYKWQYFMLDFCYFANILTFIMIWAVPGSLKYCMVFFALTNGPLMWATVIYRNSMVFYSCDKMTSLYIHIMPALVSYVIRWYPKEVSKYWYTPFVSAVETDVGNLFLYLVACSLAGYILHTLLYIVLIYGIFRPGEEYIYSYNYLLSSGPGWIQWLANRLGKMGQFVVYFTINWGICLATSMLGILWYKYHVAHTLFVIFILLCSAWNGGTYYIDVLGRKGLRQDNQL